MTKKIVSLLLILTMLVTLSPAVAADDSSATPTIEEILNRYHVKAFEAKIAEERDGASTYSRRSGTEKTPEEEAVDELTAAGYEAYNVTPENYYSLEEALHTDFSTLGLDPNSSYVIVISGDGSNHSDSPQSRVVDLPNYDYEDEGAGATTFSYTYGSTTYTMRYITVTSATNIHYSVTKTYSLLNASGQTVLNNCLSKTISVSTGNADQVSVGTVQSILGINTANIDTSYTTQLVFYGTATWVRKFLQIYEQSSGNWYTRVIVEDVTQISKITATYYSKTLGDYDDAPSNKVAKTTYSMHYYDSDFLKEEAVLQNSHNGCYYDYTGAAKFYYGSTRMFTISEPSTP